MGSILTVIQSKELGWIREQIEDFTQSVMSEYLVECRERCKNLTLSPYHTKNFYDSVWGTIEINEGEIFILDSPILQRLRKIKQLGLADLLYSSANHTRFSHTLGVLQTADVMAEQIEKELKRKHGIIEKDMRQITRLAALFHDCGHMFCSHASERYFQKHENALLYDRIEKTQYKFSHLNISPSLSELIAILIVNSNAVRQLLDIIQNGLVDFQFDFHNQDEIVEKICCMILGFPYSEKTIPFAQIISGQIDADKLDYLKRDSHSTGVPVAVDMSRIFQKLRVVEADKSYQMIAKHEEIANVYKIAIAPAALNTIDQLVISRAMMFENIYYHQKTITAEDMLRYAMYKIDMSTTGVLDDFRNILLLTDDIIVSERPEKNLKSFIKKIVIKDKEQFKEACEILRKLSNRQLFKRSVAFTDRNLTKVIQKDGLNDFYSRIIGKNILNEQEAFIRQVTDKVNELKQILSGSKFYFNKRTDIRLLIAPGVSTSSQDSNIAIDTKTRKDRNMEFEADNWLKSRSSRKSQNYLVTYSEDRYLVYIATEMVLLREYGVLINDTIIYSDEDENQINELKSYLDARKCFDELHMLAPDAVVDSYIGKINELVEKWRQYEIYNCKAEKSVKMDASYIKTHMKQYIRFRSELGNFDAFVKEYLDMLSNVVIVSKEKIATALQKNFKKILENESCNKNELQICNIGTAQDGSAIVTYHVNIVNQCMGTSWKARALERILEEAQENQRIVVLEDAFCSGKQILSIFETYMGIPLEERQTKEVHVEELRPELKEKLQKCKLIFSFIYYEKNNMDFFIKRMNEIGLLNISINAQDTFPSPYFDADAGTENEKSIAKAYMQKAGKVLIDYKAHDEKGNRKSSWTDERMQSSILGYNDAQQLIAFSWNTPTYTMTPLWMGVDTDKLKWIPLFPRIDK